MDSMDVEVLRSAIAWCRRGHRVVMGTVVHTWGSSPRPPGSVMIVRDDGQVAGSLSGGCIEDDLVERVRRAELNSMFPMQTRYGANAEESQRFGLPCGGSVHIVLEPLGEQSLLPQLLHEVAQHRVVKRQLDLRTGHVTLEPARNGDTLRCDGQTLITVHGPRLRLLIIGAGQLSHYLASGAIPLDYHITVCDPREEYHENWRTLAGVQFSREMPDDTVQTMQLDACSAVVAATHDPKLDDLGLMEALKTPAFYVAAIGSLRNNEARRVRLREFDLTDPQIAALHGPAGLNLGGKTPPEIALAILAEMTAIRHGTDLNGALTDWSRSTTACTVLA